MGKAAKDGLSKQEWLALNQGKHFCQCKSCHGIVLVEVKGWHKFSPRGIPRYIRGHYKGPWADKPMPEDVRKKCGDARKGKKMSAEAKRKIGLAGIGRIKSAEERYKSSQRRLGKSWGRHTEEMKKHFSDTRSGANSPSWKGGLTDPSKTARAKSYYKAWRSKVFERDGYRCQMPECVTADSYVEPHHIKPFGMYPEYRYDVSNGITLCRPCHIPTMRHEQRYEDLFNGILSERKEMRK